MNFKTFVGPCTLLPLCKRKDKPCELPPGRVLSFVPTIQCLNGKPYTVCDKHPECTLTMRIDKFDPDTQEEVDLVMSLNRSIMKMFGGQSEG